ncbi:hypothetical protein MTO96_033470 [Rhipicephalus appendiculatus]
MPVVIAYLGLVVYHRGRPEATPKHSYINLSTVLAKTVTEASTRTFIGEDTADNTSLRYKGLLQSENIPYDAITDVLGTLRAKYNKNVFEYLSTYAFGSAFNQTVIEMWRNPFSVLGPWVLQNLIDTTLLRERIGQPNARFDTGISLVQLTGIETKADESDSDKPIYEAIYSIWDDWVYWGIILPMGIGLITSSFVVLPSMEMCNEARELQLMTGVSGGFYLGTHFFFDLLFYLVPLTTIYFGFAMAFNLSGSTQVLQTKTGEPWRDGHILSPSGEGIFYDLSLMLIYGTLIFLYLLKRVSAGRPQKNTLPVRQATTPKDEDVAAEWASVEKMCNRSGRDFAKNTMVVRKLHKSYGTLQAVKELSLALRPAECFGLLGVNGAGKTTTFRMLTALTPMTYGEAFMTDVALSEDPRKWQSRIGYCPQRDALLGKLNAYENLYLFGRLRGVPEKSLPDIVGQMIEVTGLQQYADKRCDYYR